MLLRWVIKTLRGGQTDHRVQTRHRGLRTHGNQSLVLGYAGKAIRRDALLRSETDKRALCLITRLEAQSTIKNFDPTHAKFRGAEAGGILGELTASEG